MNKIIIKKKFKCPVCKRKYPITVDMVRDVYHFTRFHDREYSKAFNCPTCGTIFNNWGGSNWEHNSWEYFNAR